MTRTVRAVVLSAPIVCVHLVGLVGLVPLAARAAGVEGPPSSRRTARPRLRW